jgi:hypothetical protein
MGMNGVLPRTSCALWAKAVAVISVAATTVALQSLDARDIIDRYRGEYFFLDPLLLCWIRSKVA